MIEGFLQKGEQLFRFGPSYSLKMGLYVNGVSGGTYHARGLVILVLDRIRFNPKRFVRWWVQDAALSSSLAEHIIRHYRHWHVDHDVPPSSCFG